MTDTPAITRIREALEAGPTPGPWRAEDTTYQDDDGYPETPIVSPMWSAFVAVAIDFGQNNPKERDINAAYIAAANPEALRELLARLDAAEKALLTIAE